MEDITALDRLWSELLTRVNPLRPARMEKTDLLECVLSHASSWFAERRGAQNKWSYGETGRFANQLEGVLLAKLANTDIRVAYDNFQKTAFELHKRKFDPFPACSRICRQEPPICLYRRAAEDMIDSNVFSADWVTAEKADLKKDPNRRSATWEVSMDAGYEIIEFLDETYSKTEIEVNHGSARRASLCFGQQMLFEDPSKSSGTALRIIDKIIKEAGHE
jgi:hypothetical protein